MPQNWSSPLLPPAGTRDLLLPVVSYGQQSAFQPTGAHQWLSYELITADWILATTVVAGLSRALYRG